MTSALGSFVYLAAPQRVVFGVGTVSQIPDELDRLGAQRVLVLSTPAQRELATDIAKLCGSRVAGAYANATMHTPVHITEEALGYARSIGADCILSVGGGSTTGLGKAIAASTGLPQLVVPTTYAGSEATAILGETSNGLKTTRRGPEILPEVIVYDVELTLGLPIQMSATSGMNAMAHAVEALYARDANPIITLLAEESIAALARSLPLIVSNPNDPQARRDALYGAWLAGTCLGSVEMAIHHKLCHTLGGSFNLPHAETHAVLLAYSVAYVAPAVPEAMDRLVRALGKPDDDAASALFALGRTLGIPPSLEAIGMKAEDLPTAAKLAVANPYWNPMPLKADDILEQLKRAQSGQPPYV